MIESGLVTSVSPRQVGSPVTQLALAGDVLLVVEDNVDLSPGDEVLVTPEDGDPEYYTIADVDPETGVTLTTPLVADAPEGTWVAITPLQYETIAMVRMVESGEVEPCVVLHTLNDALRPGIRDESTSETVLVAKVGDDRYVFDIVARQTVRDISNAEKGTPPAAPTDLVLTSIAYLDEFKRLQSQITATWSPVLFNSDGSPITDLDKYEVQIHKGNLGGTEPWHLATSTEQDITQTFLRPFAPASDWSLRVRAVDTSGNNSDWSAPATITTAADDLPPSTPATPTATTRMGSIRVNWNGKNSAGGAMEGDFAYVEVHLSTTSGFTPTPGAAATLIDRMTGAGYTVFGPATYGTNYYVKFIAVDTSGNASPASAQATAVVAPLVDVSNFPDDAMVELYARTGHFITLTADNFSSNLIDADFIDFGSLNGALITGLQIQTDPTTDAFGNPLPLRGIKIKNTGIEGYDSTTHVRKFFLNPTTGELEGTVITGPTVRTSTTATVTGMVFDSSGLHGYLTGSTMIALDAATGNAAFHGTVDTFGDVNVNGAITTNGLNAYSGISILTGNLITSVGYGLFGNGVIATAGGADITGNSRLRNAVTIDGITTFNNSVSGFTALGQIIAPSFQASGSMHAGDVYVDSRPTAPGGATPNVYMNPTTGRLLLIP